MATSPKFLIPLPEEGVENATALIADALKILEVSSSINAIDRLNTPPGAPTEGQCWEIYTTPTGAWDGHANEFAMWLNSAWHFFPKSTGIVWWRQVDNDFLVYDGATDVILYNG